MVWILADFNFEQFCIREICFSNDTIPFWLASLKIFLSPMEPVGFQNRSYLSLRAQHSFILKLYTDCESLPLKKDFRDWHLPAFSVFKTEMYFFSGSYGLVIRHMYELLSFPSHGVLYPTWWVWLLTLLSFLKGKHDFEKLKGAFSPFPLQIKDTLPVLQELANTICTLPVSQWLISYFVIFPKQIELHNSS